MPRSSMPARIARVCVSSVFVWKLFLVHCLGFLFCLSWRNPVAVGYVGFRYISVFSPKMFEICSKKTNFLSRKRITFVCVCVCAYDLLMGGQWISSRLSTFAYDISPISKHIMSHSGHDVKESEKQHMRKRSQAATYTSRTQFVKYHAQSFQVC